MVAVLAADAACAQAVRRAGEWQVTVTPAGRPPNPPRNFCFAEGSLADITKRVGACPSHETHVAGDQLTVDATCLAGTRRSRVHLVITSHGPNAYHADIQMSVTPPMPGLSTMAMSQDARWLGPCPAGDAPAP